MSQLEAPHRLFELPFRMGRDFVSALSDDLRRRFEAQHQRPLGDPVADLALMRQAVFDPVAREERLRRELDGLRKRLAWEPPPGTPELLALPISEEAWLLTPEGRLAIPALEAVLHGPEGESVSVDELDISAVEHTLAETYREWTRYRLGRVLTLRAGKDRPMLPAAIATVLFLLVNGNLGPEAALAQPKTPDEQARLDAAVTAPIERFAQAIDSGQRGSGADPRHLQLYNGYGLSEARRRLGNDIVLERDPDDPESKSKRLYVAANAEARVIAALIKELAARKVAKEKVAAAFDQMVASYEEQRPQIAAFGVTNARPSRTQRLREELLEER